MSDVVVFHHAQGLTDGVLAFAEGLHAAGHRVTTPDLYDGRTFPTLEAGIGFAEELGFGTILERGRAAVTDLPIELVYAGFSLGVLPAQLLAQTRPGALGALFFHACVPHTEFTPAWPAGVPVQIHAMDADPVFTTEGDLEAARELVDQVDGAGLFLYPGREHLFTDSGLPGFDADATTLLTQRVLRFLDTTG